MDIPEINSINDKFNITFNKNSEHSHRDTFSKANAIFLPDKNAYQILKTENDFKTKKEYNSYIKKYKSKMCTLYKSDTCNEKSKVGTVLFDFLKYDFNNFEAYQNYVFKYGFPAIYGLFNDFEEVENPFHKTLKLKTLNGKKAIYITPDEFTKICKKFYTEENIKYIKISQGFLKKALMFSYNIDNIDYLENLSVNQRFLIYQNMSPMASVIIHMLIFHCTSVGYSLDIVKEDSDFHDLLNFADNDPRKLAKYIQTHKKEFSKIPNQLLSFTCKQLESVCFISLLQLIQNEIPVNICKNCGNFFIPTSRKNTLYCNNIFENNKTCQEIGAMITYNENLKKDEINSLYRKTLSAKKMLANRNPDIPMYLEKYEQWKKEANQFKKCIKEGKKTEEEFKEWIENTKKSY